MKYKFCSVLIFIYILFSSVIVNAQCPCSGGNAVGGLMHVTGSGNIGVLKKGNFRASAFYVYSYGNDYYANDSKTNQGVLKEFSTSFLGFNFGYGINEDLTAEAELYSYPDKTQDYYYFKFESSGFSHISLNLKYNIISLRSKELEWTIGAGGKIPFSTGTDLLPAAIQPSTGAYGFIVQSFLHKGFKDIGLHLILANRLENNFENKDEYQYGYSAVNSLFITKSIIDNLAGVLEIRGDTRTRDKRYGDYIPDSGNNTIILSPQIGYSFSGFSFSIMYDFPVYKYYFGRQLTKDYSAGAAISWQTKL
ncbi:MAG: hypothetical protein WCT77_11205 [Bacteroidota bacterium]